MALENKPFNLLRAIWALATPEVRLKSHMLEAEIARHSLKRPGSPNGALEPRMHLLVPRGKQVGPDVLGNITVRFLRHDFLINTGYEIQHDFESQRRPNLTQSTILESQRRPSLTQSMIWIARGARTLRRV